MTTLRMHSELGGAFAEDKDVARVIRAGHILPCLAKQQHVCLDFNGIEVATQSFIHACISEPIRKYGDVALKYLEFRGCVDTVKSVIQTVAEYSIYFCASSGIQNLSSNEVPQADDLRKVRLTLVALSVVGGRTALVVDHTGYSRRHARYRIQANELLGFWRDGQLTEIGGEFLNSVNGSDSEKEILQERVMETKVFQTIVPDLFERMAPSTTVIGKRLSEHVGLSVSTGMRRASCLLSWRSYITSNQMLLL